MSLMLSQVCKLWLADRQEEGSSNLGDNAVRAYNFRLCLTTDPANRVAIPKPASYNREEYLSLAEDVLSGRHSGIEWGEMSPALKDSNAALRAQGKAPVGKWMPEEHAATREQSDIAQQQDRRQ